MEIVKLVVGAKGQELDGRPAEIVPAVFIISSPDPQHKPADKSGKMEGAKK